MMRSWRILCVVLLAGAVPARAEDYRERLVRPPDYCRGQCPRSGPCAENGCPPGKVCAIVAQGDLNSPRCQSPTSAYASKERCEKLNPKNRWMDANDSLEGASPPVYFCNTKPGAIVCREPRQVRIATPADCNRRR